MDALYRAIVGFMVWLSADPQAVDLERPRAAAAVHAAVASMAKEGPAPAPAPTPTPTKCCGECGGRGYIVMPDGHRVACPCAGNCPCKSKTPADCPDGKCPPVPRASPTTASSAVPAGRR
jgi:hypothetical protein